MKKTVIYVLLSMLLGLGGILGFLADESEGRRAIWTSLLAGGIASIAFAAIRYFDDQDSDARAASLERTLEDLARAVSRLWAVQLDSRVAKRRPTEEVDALIAVVPKRSRLLVDAIGISLKPFAESHMPAILKRSADVRLLLMDPRSHPFAMFCEDQRREREGLTDEIAWTTRQFLGVWRPSDSCNVELKWDGGFQSVTLIRINDTLLFRPRLINEAAAPNVSFEIYQRAGEGALQFEAFRSYFDALWSRSIVPTEQILGELQG